jgi:hypothetical protein
MHLTKTSNVAVLGGITKAPEESVNANVKV